MTIKEFDIQNALGSLSDNIKYKLANNPNIPVEVLTKLSTDKDYSVRWRVAENSNTPKEILAKLSTDENSNVQSHAIQRI